MAGSERVSIAGAGPVGLALALALLRAGVEVRVHDRRPSIPQDHRATTVQPRTLELLADWRVLDRVMGAGLPVHHLEHWRWPARERLVDLELRHVLEDTRCPFRLHVDQWRLCQVLLAAVEALAPGAVRWGEEVIGFEDDGAGVEVQVRSRDGAITRRRSGWLVAADGQHSPIRGRLGVSLSGRGPAVPFVTAHGPASLLPAGVGPCAWLYDTAGWVMVMQMPDRVRLLAPADAAGPAALSTEATAALARRWFGPEAVGALVGLALYTVRPAVAERWRAGRVVLVGDAAHAAWPVNGTAMNGGLQDAAALAAALVEGTETAVERYAVERREWTRAFLVDRATTAMRALSSVGGSGRSARARALRALGTDPEGARQELLRASMLA